MGYIIWIPLSVILLFISAWLSAKGNAVKGSWTTYLWLYQLCTAFIPLWPLISRYSKNLVFDSILYDVIDDVVFTGALIIFSGWAVNVTWCNILGIVVVIVGLFLLRY